jgi:hypothetical protein
MFNPALAADREPIGAFGRALPIANLWVFTRHAKLFAAAGTDYARPLK